MHKGFYRVRVTMGGVRHFIGDFSTAEAAVAARENFLKKGAEVTDRMEK
jgi:hypothetical protein